MSDHLDWRGLAACVDAVTAGDDPFFSGTPDGERVALAICARCPVRDDCLDYAVESGEVYGIWGGVPQRDVRRLVALDRQGRTKNPITFAHHNALKTESDHGHPFDAANTYYDTSGQRRCRLCFRIAQAAYRRRIRRARHEAEAGMPDA